MSQLVADRGLMRLLLLLSSSEPARVAASAWLAAFDEACAAGLAEERAHAHASAACREAMAKESGVWRDRASILAVRPLCDEARPPPLARR